MVFVFVEDMFRDCSARAIRQIWGLWFAETRVWGRSVAWRGRCGEL